MTFFHFLNCSLATFMPIWVLYRASKLSEISGTWKAIVFGALMYFASQLVKLIFVAFVFSTYIETEDFVASHELIKIVLGVFDVMGAWFALKQSGASSAAFYGLFGVGLGWSFSHHLAYYFPGLWINARSLQFTYESLQNSLTAQISLAILMCLPFLTYYAMKKNSENALRSKLAVLGLLMVVGFEGASKFFQYHEGFNFLVLSAVQSVWALATVGITYVVSSRSE